MSSTRSLLSSMRICQSPQMTVYLRRMARTVSVSVQELQKKLKERDHWWAFLNGCPESEWNPPKKPKKPNTRNDRYGAGPSRIHSNPYEVDVLDYAVSMDPTESLPTPSGTPVPPDRNEEARPVEDVLVHAQESPTVTGHPKPPAAPQPTPVLLRDIDHICDALLMYFAHWIIYTSRTTIHRSKCKCSRSRSMS
ncbi:hypothetical protein BC629DRAFT_488909 [Irpex lacteus]|nr:hypothetical protein BC629DRAFT_488909 [Irpex lacteus]